MRVIGIDPGLTGAVAVLNMEGEVGPILDTPSFIMQGKRRDHDAVGMYAMLNDFLENDDHVFIEQQQSRPEAAVQSIFKVGYGFGLWVGMLVARGIKYTAVRPQTWQAAMYQGAVGEGKERSLMIASRLFPNTQIPKTRHDRADSLLLAEFGRRVLLGKLKHWEELR